ncbi:MAG: polyphosphate polymerase domain-containing protein [bacterium]
MENEFYRFEFKYEMEPSLARAIESEIKKYGMKADKHASSENHEYVVNSLYFDSYDLDDYYEKMGGYLEREKLRARIYESFLNKSQIIWLEVKKKHDTKVHKKRFALTPEQWQNFLKKGPTFLLGLSQNAGQQRIRQEVIWNFLKKPVKPHILVRYLRRPYVLGDLRVTFDRQVEACKKTDLNYNSRVMARIRNRGVIMEVKFARFLPFWFKNIIQKHDLKRDAYSKYTNSIDALEAFDPLPK